MPRNRKKRKRSRRMAAGGAAVLSLLLIGREQLTEGEKPHCGGSSRWEVKVLTDPAADSLNEFTQVKTIEDIDDLSDIDTKNEYKFGRKKGRMEIEKQVVTIHNCEIVKIIREADNDLHLVITDSKGDSMLAEAPDPNCESAADSKWIENFNRVRNTLAEHKKNYRHFKFTITGPLFVDNIHGAKGAAPNGIEIHPILDLQVE